jgi:hypothetical protein
MSFGFIINPYNPCVANKYVDEKQLTVSWHVDDLKVSHQDPNVVTDFMEWIRLQYGKIREVKVTRGQVHEYLGMKLQYDVKGQVLIDMSDYVKQYVEGLPGG